MRNAWDILDDTHEFVKLYMLVVAVNLMSIFHVLLGFRDRDLPNDEEKQLDNL